MPNSYYDLGANCPVNTDPSPNWRPHYNIVGARGTAADGAQVGLLAAFGLWLGYQLFKISRSGG